MKTLILNGIEREKGFSGIWFDNMKDLIVQNINNYYEY